MDLNLYIIKREINIEIKPKILLNQIEKVTSFLQDEE